MSTKNSSVWTELFARDNCEPRSNNSRDTFYASSSRATNQPSTPRPRATQEGRCERVRDHKWSRASV